MNRFLITFRDSQLNEGEPLIDIYPVSEDVGAKDVTYHPKTFLFFFLKTEMSQEEVACRLMTARISNVKMVLIGDEHFKKVDMFYIPEENAHLISAMMDVETGKKFNISHIRKHMVNVEII